jgi:hypothetical protein
MDYRIKDGPTVQLVTAHVRGYELAARVLKVWDSEGAIYALKYALSSRAFE